MMIRHSFTIALLSANVERIISIPSQCICLIAASCDYIQLSGMPNDCWENREKKKPKRIYADIYSCSSRAIYDRLLLLFVYEINNERPSRCLMRSGRCGGSFPGPLAYGRALMTLKIKPRRPAFVRASNQQFNQTRDWEALCQTV